MGSAESSGLTWCGRSAAEHPAAPAGTPRPQSRASPWVCGLQAQPSAGRRAGRRRCLPRPRQSGSGSQPAADHVDLSGRRVDRVCLFFDRTCIAQGQSRIDLAGQLGGLDLLATSGPAGQLTTVGPLRGVFSRSRVAPARRFGAAGCYVRCSDTSDTAGRSCYHRKGPWHHRSLRPTALTQRAPRRPVGGWLKRGATSRATPGPARARDGGRCVRR
jgi:hypothetical protein